MGRVKGFLFFGGLVLIFGPFVGLTLRGLGGLTHGQSTLLGILFIAVSVVWGIATSSNVATHTPTRITEPIESTNNDL